MDSSARDALVPALAPVSPAVVVIARDASSETRFGSGTWDRAVLARIVAALARAGATAIGVDIVPGRPGVPGRGGAASDALLAQAAAAAGNVVFIADPGAASAPGAGAPPSVTRSSSPMPDGVVRRVPLSVKLAERDVPALGLALAATAGADADAMAGRIPTDRAGRAQLRWAPDLPVVPIERGLDGDRDRWRRAPSATGRGQARAADHRADHGAAAHADRPAVGRRHPGRGAQRRADRRVAAPAAGAVDARRDAAGGGARRVAGPRTRCRDGRGRPRAPGARRRGARLDRRSRARRRAADRAAVRGADAGGASARSCGIRSAPPDACGGSRARWPASGSTWCGRNPPSRALEEDLEAARAVVARSTGAERGLLEAADALRAQLAAATAQEEQTRLRLHALERELRAADRPSGVPRRRGAGASSPAVRGGRHRHARARRPRPVPRPGARGAHHAADLARRASRAPARSCSRAPLIG